MKYPLAIQELIDALSKFPSVGPKTAERYVFHLLKQSPEELTNLASNISQLSEKITRCQDCRVLTDSNPCSICQDDKRNKKLICLVENTQDLWALENTGNFNGNYFVLGGLINAIEDQGPDKLPIQELANLLKKNQAEELIVALNFTMEGESTVLYLKKALSGLKISRLARGLPSGSDLEYADELTLSNALKFRQNIK